MTLIVVLGPPASGKSTWVLERARYCDIVIDFDRMAAALTGEGADGHGHHPAVKAVTQAARTAAIQTALHHRGRVDVYLIHSTPGTAALTRYRQLGARLVTIDPGRDVVLDRCRRLRPRAMIAVAERWYAEHGHAGLPDTERQLSVDVHAL